MKIQIFEGLILEHQDGSEYEVIHADRHGVTLQGQGEFLHMSFHDLAADMRNREFLVDPDEATDPSNLDSG